MKRDASKTIWRTVVFAGAMLGAPACGKKQAQTTPQNTTTEPAAAETAPADPANATPAEPAAAADPCEGGERPRGADPCAGGGGTGRGFVLS
jgi:hypothetical protein